MTLQRLQKAKVDLKTTHNAIVALINLAEDTDCPQATAAANMALDAVRPVETELLDYIALLDGSR